MFLFLCSLQLLDLWPLWASSSHKASRFLGHWSGHEDPDVLLAMMKQHSSLPLEKYICAARFSQAIHQGPCVSLLGGLRTPLSLACLVHGWPAMSLWEQWQASSACFEGGASESCPLRRGGILQLAAPSVRASKDVVPRFASCFAFFSLGGEGGGLSVLAKHCLPIFCNAPF